MFFSPDSGDDSCGSRTDDIDELIDVELSVPIDIPNSEQGLDLLVGEPGPRLPELLLTTNQRLEFQLSANQPT